LDGKKCKKIVLRTREKGDVERERERWERKSKGEKMSYIMESVRESGK
jgi:hypothetical protein